MDWTHTNFSFHELCVGEDRNAIFTDTTQDEWVVANLTFDIAKQFPGLVARVADVDAEVLLIESAQALYP
ncbi:hypothetical protein PF005_g14842 [Phytophthora fragariae]|uniref:Uncharacterized protein n=1 Tax=Phytophthora fragariae TaxID=53985 RepID=A0A6A3RME7_9STRA|nr:hypothetical protein PF003_g40325 [Phytophthora fragariae]KAE8934838.1 hypothetical protein PF009_g15200 [Phytophthora fragariae]KAE9098723.1 hypothetical protein PF007_g16154 [Phytophthora fragariae]KAE9117729.1 hypothetical protein PF006_g18754 [Phytophthora fragariae]KAE9201732.1 hypothetical protein PF005_g14842 [Phytophthora fragariae]